MKQILLHSPTVRNNGAYADSGTILRIGYDPREIRAARAKELVDNSRAIETGKRA